MYKYLPKALYSAEKETEQGFWRPHLKSRVLAENFPNKLQAGCQKIGLIGFFTDYLNQYRLYLADKKFIPITN